VIQNSYVQSNVCPSHFLSAARLLFAAAYQAHARSARTAFSQGYPLEPFWYSHPVCYCHDPFIHWVAVQWATCIGSCPAGASEAQEAQQVAVHAHNLEAQAHAHAEAQVQAAVQAHSLAAKAQAHAHAQVSLLANPVFRPCLAACRKLPELAWVIPGKFAGFAMCVPLRLQSTNGSSVFATWLAIP